MRVTYGIDVLDKEDPYIATAESAVRAAFAAAMPGAFLIDSIPILRYVPEWIPGASFKRKAKEWRRQAEDMANKPFDAAMKNIRNGDATFSFVSDSSDKIDPTRDISSQELAIRDAAGTMYSAGSDTTVSAIASCILAMLENPQVLRKAQKQVDEVVGNSRLPTFDDEDSLPYITAMVKESLRWRDVAPIGVPHHSDAEDEYKGYRIPAGSVIVPNCWAMLHDPNIYPEPFEFKPERFLKDGQLDPDAKDPAHAAFGFGRRICPGRFMALSSLWIAIASIVAVFDISKAIDENGNEVPLSHEYISALGILPKPFKCSIKPRSAEAEELIKATSSMIYD